MFSRIFRGVLLATLIGLIWVGYRRGAFDRAGSRMRSGLDRFKEQLQAAGNRARERLMRARNRAGEGVGMLSDVAREKATQALNRVEHATQ